MEPTQSYTNWGKKAPSSPLTLCLEYHHLVTLPAQARNIAIQERYSTPHLAHFLGGYTHINKPAEIPCCNIFHGDMIVPVKQSRTGLHDVR